MTSTMPMSTSMSVSAFGLPTSTVKIHFKKKKSVTLRDVITVSPSAAYIFVKQSTEKGSIGHLFDVHDVSHYEEILN